MKSAATMEASTTTAMETTTTTTTTVRAAATVLGKSGCGDTNKDQQSTSCKEGLHRSDIHFILRSMAVTDLPDRPRRQAVLLIFFLVVSEF
jgi:hypothetical protein